MKTLKLSILTFLFLAASSPCFALREIMVLTKKEAKEMGFEVRTTAVGADAVRLELEFKPEGKLKEFTHVELSVAGEEKAFVFSTELRETRTSAGNVVFTFTANRAWFEKITLSVVQHSPAEAGDHTCELRMKDFADVEKAR